jgi:hypothetical protein
MHGNNMKHVKLFEQFINEAEKPLEVELAQAILNRLVSNNDVFDQEVYLSNGDRDVIKSEYNNRLPREVAGPNKSMMCGSILRPLGKDVYVDGQNLVLGDKTILHLKDNTTWSDVAKTLGL